MIFRQLFDPQSSTFTYLLADESTREAVLIDPVFEQARRDAALLNELGLQLRWTLETHIHADHVSGAWLLKLRVGSSIAVGAASGAEGADRYLEDGDEILLGAHALRTLATPGHTSGCVTYVLDDLSRAFTGDCLLVRGTGRTDFQGGDAAAMYRSVRERIFALPDSCLLHPAHDYRGLTVTSVGEERKFNPRLGGDVALGDFTGHMANLKLAHPKQMDVAVPANLGKEKCKSQCEDQIGHDVRGDHGPKHARMGGGNLGVLSSHDLRVETPVQRHSNNPHPNNSSHKTADIHGRTPVSSERMSPQASRMARFVK